MSEDEDKKKVVSISTISTKKASQTNLVTLSPNWKTDQATVKEIMESWVGVVDESELVEVFVLGVTRDGAVIREGHWSSLDAMLGRLTRASIELVLEDGPGDEDDGEE